MDTIINEQGDSIGTQVKKPVATPFELVARKTPITAAELTARANLLQNMISAIEYQYEPCGHDPTMLLGFLAVSKELISPSLPVGVDATPPAKNSALIIPGFVFSSFSNQRVYFASQYDLKNLPDKMSCVKVEIPIQVQIDDVSLVEMFTRFGPIYEFRVLVDSKSGLNSGRYYITFVRAESALMAAEGLNNFLIGDGREMSVTIVIPRKRLFVGNIPKSKSHHDLEKSFTVLTSSLVKVINFPDKTATKGNRGFCFLDYATHGAAVAARRRLAMMKVFGCDLQVDWAEKRRSSQEAVKTDENGNEI